MPDNIKFFEYILIGHFDSRTIDFLRRINTLFTGVNLILYDLTEELLPMIFDHLLPLIHGIHSLRIRPCAISQVEQSFGQKLAQVKMLKLKSCGSIRQTTINFCMNWIISEEQADQIEPKFLKVNIPSNDFQQFSAAIQQQFLSAKSTSTFAIHIKLLYCWDYSHIVHFHLENNLGEQLHGQFINAHGKFQISRYQPNDNKALHKWVEGTAEKSFIFYSGINFLSALTIGPIDANTGDNGVKAEADHPSPSRDKQ